MNETRASALQLCPFSAYLEAGLNARFKVVRWFEMDEGARAAWLAAHGPSVRAVVTGGHIGCTNALIESLPALGVIAINGVGFDKVDLDFARRHGVSVTTTPGVLTDDVADLAIGLIIGLLRGIPAADSFVRAGEWPKGDRAPARQVSGCRFGIVGLGRIGEAIAARLAVFGPVAYAGTREKPVPYAFHADATALARWADVLVIACAASPATRHLIDGGVLEALGPDGYLVNIARGSVVDEAALAAALQDNRLAGAALDVFEDEPDVPEALLRSPRTVLTPHIASATVETRRRMADLVLANLDALTAGMPLPSALE